MEVYYFIERKRVKEGPYRLSELKEQTIYSDTIIWRSDNDQWKKDIEFEELKDFCVAKPPLTPIEEKSKEIHNDFIRSTLPICDRYICLNIFGLITYFIFNCEKRVGSWEK